MSHNPIYYKDLVSPDDSIKRLIGELKELNGLYSEVVSTVKSSAIEIQTSIKSSSGATKEGREQIEKAASSTDRLKRAQEELKFAMSETGKQVAWLKSQISETNRTTVETRKFIDMATGSYSKIKSSLAKLVSTYKSLSAEQRNNAEVGGNLLNSILAYKQQIAQLDAQMKPHIQTITALEKAKRKLAYLQSEDGKQLMEINAQIRAITQGRKQQKATIDALAAAQERLKLAQSEENGQLKLYTTLINEANKVAKLNAIIANSAEGSYNRLSAQYELNKIKLNAMSAEQRSAAESGKKLEAETKAIYQQMIKLQEATGNHRLSVGNYARAWDGLGVSVNQIIRELPAAAISLNTFFLGISNNIPMLVDEIQRLREQNKAFRAEGKPTKSVIGSITKSLLSWNSVLVVMLTVFAMHGEAIISWIANIFKGHATVKSMVEILQDLNKELETTNANYGDNIATLKKLQSEWSRLTSNDEKLKFIEKNEDKWKDLNVAIKDVNDAENLLVNNTDDFINALKARAKAAAAMKLASESYEKSFIKEEEAKAMADVEPTFGQTVLGSLVLDPSWMPGSLASKNKTSRGDVIRESEIRRLDKEAKAAKQTGDAYFKLAEAHTAEEQALLKKLGLSEYTGDKKGRMPTDPTNTINNLNLSAYKKYQDSLTRLEDQEFAERKRKALETYKTNSAELKNMLDKNTALYNEDNKKYKKLTDEQKQTLLETERYIISSLEQERRAYVLALEQIERDWQLKELQIQNETIELRLQAVKEGSQEELELRLQAIEAQRQIALNKNASLPKDQRQKVSDINASFDKQTVRTSADYMIADFDEYQALEDARFNIVERSEEELTRFRLQQEKARWSMQLELAKVGGLDWSEKQIETVKATIDGIDRQLADLDDIWRKISEKGLAGGILSSLGFNDEQLNALSQATNIVVSQLNEILEAEIALAEKEAELAQERADNARSAYEAEIEARNNGYAHSVDTAKKELLLEQRNQMQKQKLLEQAQRRQEQIDSMSQASSLITASANLWSAFSKIPYVGPALALAAIATMWGSFAAAKIKANQVTTTQEYGEGGLEFLEGGSHASGNDIDLGVTNSRKRRMKAEGGEALAIINKRNTRRYKKLLPDIIDSLNKGNFEDKYFSAFSSDNNYIMNNNSNVDLSTLENSVSAIKKQGETKYYSISGKTIEIKGNVKRIIKG